MKSVASRFPIVALLLVWALISLVFHVSAKATSAQDLLVTSFSNEVLRYAGGTGDFLGAFIGPDFLNIPDDLKIGPDGFLYVTSNTPFPGAIGGNIARFHPQTGEFIDVFAHGDTVDTGRLNVPRGLAFRDDGDLFVPTLLPLGGPSIIQHYDGATGEFIDTFYSQPLASFEDLAFGPDGNLYVLTSPGMVVLDGQTGDLLQSFNVGGRSLTFGNDGLIYVGGSTSVAILDPETGVLLGTFASGGGLDRASGLIFGPDGDLYVSSFFTANVLRYDGVTGDFIEEFASGGGLDFPRGLLFIPEPATGMLTAAVAVWLLRKRRRMR